jgi:hypothetical protein
MTNNDEDNPRIITMEQWVDALEGEPDFAFIDLPLTPKHTDEEYDKLIVEQRATNLKGTEIILRLQARIKELEAEMKNLSIKEARK